MNFEDFVKQIPYVLEYFVPGYISLTFYRALMNSEDEAKSSEQIHLATCICISYLLALIFGQIDTLIIRFIFETIVGCFVSFLMVKLLGTKRFRHYFSLINHTTISKTVFEAIGLHLQDQWVTVYLKDGSMVYGRVVVFGSETTDQWISIDNYRTSGPSFDMDTGKKDEWYKNEKKSIDEVLTIQYGEIRMISLHRWSKSKPNKPTTTVTSS